MVPKTCSPSPCCCQRVFPKNKLCRPLTGSFPRAGRSKPRVWLLRTPGLAALNPKSGCSDPQVWPLRTPGLPLLGGSPCSGRACPAPAEGFWGAEGPQAGLAVAAAIFSVPKAAGTPSAAFPFASTPPSLLLLSNTTKIPPPKKAFTDSSCIRKKTTPFFPFLSPDPASIKQISKSY